MGLNYNMLSFIILLEFSFLSLVFNQFVNFIFSIDCFLNLLYCLPSLYFIHFCCTFYYFLSSATFGFVCSSFFSFFRFKLRLFEKIFFLIQAFIGINFLELLFLHLTSFSMPSFHFFLSQDTFYVPFGFFFAPLVVQKYTV